MEIERNPFGLGVEKVETGTSGCQALTPPTREKRSRHVQRAILPKISQNGRNTSMGEVHQDACLYPPNP